MSPPEPELCVVCPTFQRPEVLARLIRALEQQTFPMGRFEVRIVDDCSDDDTGEVLARLAAETSLHLIPMSTPTNGGPAAARNLGWRSTTAPVVAFTDDDCTPSPGWLSAGMASLGADDRIGVVQGRVTRPDVPLGPWTVFREHNSATPYFEGCNVFYRRSALLETAGFDEGFTVAYGEDTDLGWRVVDAGWSRAYAAAAVVLHDVEERGFSYHLRAGLQERHVVGIGARHPGLAADAYWRPWAWRPEEVAMAFAVLGLVGAVRTPASAVLSLPWLWLRWPRRGYRTYPFLGAQLALLDLVRLVAHVAGSVRHRTFVL